MKKINKVAIVGMGALGLLYGNHIAEHKGKDAVEYVMDAARVEKYRDTVFTVNDTPVDLVRIEAQKAAPADLLIVAVKYTGLSAALKVMKNCIGPDTIIMSVLNGITSEDEIGAHFGRPVALYTVPQGMDAMKFGPSLRYTQMGNLHIGAPAGADTEDLESVIAFFEEIGMPYIHEKDILYRMWFKFMLNVGVNQTCMAYDCPYSGVTNPGPLQDIMLGVMDEVRILAVKKGIALTEKDMQTCIEIERTLDPNGTPSMGQDRLQKRASEVDMFAGTVMRLGAELGIPTPNNEAMYRRVKEIEKDYAKA